MGKGPFGAELLQVLCLFGFRFCLGPSDYRGYPLEEPNVIRATAQAGGLGTNIGNNAGGPPQASP